LRFAQTLVTPRCELHGSAPHAHLKEFREDGNKSNEEGCEESDQEGYEENPSAAPTYRMLAQVSRSFHHLPQEEPS
jgi:hypothetical protein